jgi:hypothetical protein
MAKNETKRLRPAQVTADNDAFASLKKIANYAPNNPAYVVANGTTLQTTHTNTSDAEAQALSAYNTARDLAIKAEWAFHNYMLGVKNQVISQFGDDSNEIQSLGIKKKSEYKKPKAKPKPAAPKA